MITLTKEIEVLLSELPEIKRAEVLTRAWNACCDGAYLANEGVVADLWDGGHELQRSEFELEVVTEFVENEMS